MFDSGCPRGRVRQNDGAVTVGLIGSYRTQSVMAGLVPAIHVFILGQKDVDVRAISAFTRVFRGAMRGHDGGKSES
jgi:hypothetical protein